MRNTAPRIAFFVAVTLTLGVTAAVAQHSQPSIDHLIRQLQSGQAEKQIAAARILARRGEAAKRAVEALTNRLDDENAEVRAYAAYALGQIGKSAESAAPALIKIVVDKDPIVRRAARDALRRIGAPREKTIPLLAKTLKEASPNEVISALHTLAEIGEEAIPFLSEAIEHEQGAYWAALVVAELGPQAKSLAPKVAKLLEHQEPDVRMQAAMALGEIGPEAAAAAPALIDALQNDEYGAVRYAAAYALAKIGAKDRQTQSALKETLRAEDGQLQVLGAWALLQLDPQDEQLREQADRIIFEGLKSDNATVRETAVRALIELDAKEVAPSQEVFSALAEALGDADPNVVAQVIEGFAAKGADALPHLGEALKNEDLRPYAVKVVARLGEDGKKALPHLIDILEDPNADAELKRETQFALGNIGPAAAPAVDALIKSLAAEDPEVRYSACYALGEIGPAAQRAMPSLAALLTSDDSFLQLAAVWAMLRIQTQDLEVIEQALPILIRGLSDEREHIRVEAAAALGELGPAAQAALKALEKALKDESLRVRAAAEKAIEQIRADTKE